MVIFVNKPLVEPTARVPPSDMKSTEVKGDSAVITFTDLNKNKKKKNLLQTHSHVIIFLLISWWFRVVA